MSIDAHQHFWHYNPENHSWISDNMAVLKKDFLPADLEKLLVQNNFQGCVAVQADQCEEETDFLVELSQDYPIIKGVVGWVDLRAKDIEERLSRFSLVPNIKGFRHVVQDEPDDQFMLWSDFKNGLGHLEKHGFTYDILIFPKQLGAALQSVKKFPHQKFVVDHIAKPPIQTGEIAEWKKTLQSIAAHDNVMCKLSGMVTEADWSSWSYDDLLPYMDVVLEAFGTERVMFGSDWPVCQLAAQYHDVLNVVRKFIGTLSFYEQEKILGLNAINFYDL